MSNFNVQQKYNSCTFNRPKIIGFMSVDGHREYHPDITQLKFLNHVPTEKLCLDLNHGITNAVKRTTDENNEKITLLLKFLLHNYNLLEFNLPEPRLICYRRTLISVMCNAFNNDHVSIMACLFKGSIYLCSLETPKELHYRLSHNRQEDRFCAWGYKFEQYMLADCPNIQPNIERPLIENEEFSLVYKTSLGCHELVYGAQIDGMLATDGTVSNPPKTTDNVTILNYLKKNAYVELKTNRLIQSQQQESNFKKFKMLRCWCQCYLADLKGLLVGYRDDNGFVTGLRFFNTEDIPKYCMIYLDEDGKIKESTCTCPRGLVRCHHMSALLLYCLFNISVTDVACTWSARKPLQGEDIIKTIAELYPEKKKDYNAVAALSTHRRSNLYESLKSNSTLVGFSWLLAPEPNCAVEKTLEDFIFSMEFENSKDTNIFAGVFSNEWHPARSLRFLEYFLSFAKSTFKECTVNKNEPISFKFDLHGSRNPITVSQCDGDEPILPEWYIEALKNKK